MLQPQMKAPTFTAEAVVNGQFKNVSLEDYKGKNVVVFFYPLDFTFVCPTEIIAFSDRIAEFHKRNTEVIGISTDSKFSHLAWINTSRKEGGLGGLNYPLVADFTKQIARDYNVLLEGGMALRGSFLIDKNGILRHMVVNDLPLGRSVDETLRMIDALTHFETHGEVCPMDWKPGQDGMVTTQEGKINYFEKNMKTPVNA
jgi:alkyl hydroperoxide reductase subunit AhpC